MAYYQLEPFGSPADDDRFRQLCTMTISPHLTRGAELPVFFDRDPTPKSIEDDIESFFASYGTVPEGE